MAIRAAELRVIIGADTSGVERGLSSTSNWLRKLSGDNQTFRGVFAGMFAGTLVTQAIGNMKSLGNEALQAYANYERLGMSLENLVAKELLNQGAAKSMAEALRMGAARAAELTSWTQKLAIESPFTQQGVADAFRTAMAYGFTTKEAQRLTQAMIDFSAGSGSSEATMGRIALALGQIQARGKVAGQEVMQLTEAGISVDKILSEAFGKSTQEIIEMREKGLIPAEMAIEAIVSALENDFGGAAKRQSGTFSGLLSSLEDIKQIGLREFFGETFRVIQPELEEFIGTLQKAETIEKVRDAGKDLANFLMDAATAARDAITWFNGLSETNQKLLIGLGGLVMLRQPVFSLLADGASLASGMMKTVGGLSESWRAWNAGLSLTTSLQAGLGALPVTLGAIALGVGSVVAVWYTWNEQITETNRRGLESTGAAWDDFFKQQAEGGSSLQQTTRAFTSSYQGVRDTIKSSGFAGLFVNQTEMAKQAMIKFEQTARDGAGTYKEYVESMIDAGIATGQLHQNYRQSADSWESNGRALQYLYQQLGLVTEREYLLAQITEDRYADDEENHFLTMATADERAAANQMLIDQQAALFAQEQLLEAQRQEQLASGRDALAGYREAILEVAEAEREWLDQTGSQLVEYLGKRLPEGSERWREGMQVIDDVMGTNELKAYDTQKAYENLMKQFGATGDVDALKAGLIEMRDEGLETVRSKMQETIDKAQELYDKLMSLPDKIRIDIEFYGQAPSWIDTVPTATTYRPGPPARTERDAIGGVGYPGEEIWVGERGPELFRPFSAGVIEPAHKSKASGLGDMIFNVYVKDPLDVEASAWQIFNFLQGRLS
jgi:tape measure domain-containing protein